MKKILILTTIVVAVIGFIYGFSHAFKSTGSSTVSTAAIVDIIPSLKDWPEASQKAATNMQEKYGNPNEVTDEMLIWNENGEWLKTILYKKEMAHDFPKSHTDVLEQWINCKVPLDKYNELATYDGSITVNRTNGTISCRCDLEAMNTLALNLAYDIIKGDKSAEQARLAYGDIALAYMKKEKPAYTQGLNFANDKFAPDSDKELDIMKNLAGN